MVKEENGYIVKTVFPIQSFAKYNIDFSLKYFKNNNIKIVSKFWYLQIKAMLIAMLFYITQKYCGGYEKLLKC